MKPIIYIDRITQKKESEKVYGGSALKFLYGDDWVSKLFGFPLLHLLAKNPIFSALYGMWQKHPFSKKKIVPFIQAFEVNPSEFLLEVSKYKSFNDFFIRHLKSEARPIIADESTAIIPADGRYLVFPNINLADGF